MHFLFFLISVRYTLVSSLKIAHILKCALIVDHFSEEEILDISLCTFIILAEANGTLNRMDEPLDWTMFNEKLNRMVFGVLNKVEWQMHLKKKVACNEMETKCRIE